MSIEPEALGGGAGAGLLSALITLFGFNRRLNKIEQDKQDKELCLTFRDSLEKRLDGIQSSIERLSERIDFFINGRRPK